MGRLPNLAGSPRCLASRQNKGFGHRLRLSLYCHLRLMMPQFLLRLRMTRFPFRFLRRLMSLCPQLLR